jgi:nicotinamidase-related amidase
MLIDKRRSLLLVIDAQERLLPALGDPDRVVANTAILLAGAARLDIPVTVTEQYPKGLGHTVPELSRRLPADAKVLAKTAFSAATEPAIAEHLARHRNEGRDHAVICGAEAHVCVLQTALELKARGWPVFVVADAVSSRSQHSVAAAMTRIVQAGCAWVTAEMVLFEWMGTAGTDDFRTLSELIREPFPRLPPQ